MNLRIINECAGTDPGFPTVGTDSGLTAAGTDPGRRYYTDMFVC